MCLCKVPTRETDPWRAPALAEGDNLLFDEPGRCKPMVNGTGSTDYHSHHFRLVQNRSLYVLLVKHGGGEERIGLGYPFTRIAELFSLLPDSDARYLMLHALYNAHREAERDGRDSERARWSLAAAERRIRVRKVRGQDKVKVSIEPKIEKSTT